MQLWGIRLPDIPIIGDLCRAFVTKYAEPLKELVEELDIAAVFCEDVPSSCDLVNELEDEIAKLKETFGWLVDKVSGLCEESSLKL